MRCPECAGQPARWRRPAFLMSREPLLTYGLIAANVVLFLATNQLGGGGGGLFGGGASELAGASPGAVRPGRRATAQYYRLITAAFIHFGPLHLAFNMYALYLIGTRAGALRRPAAGSRVIYLLSALAGSFGALLVSAERADGGRLRRHLRPDGRDAGARAAPWHRPAGRLDRRPARDQPGVHLRRLRHLGGRPHRRPDRRRRSPASCSRATAAATSPTAGSRR